MHRPAKHEQRSPAVPDKFFQQAEFFIGEKRGIDVSENDQIVLERVFAVVGESLDVLGRVTGNLRACVR